MDPRVFPIAEIFRLNAWLFHNCLDGLTDAQAQWRPSPEVNSAAFVAAHVCESRVAIAGWLDAPVENPWAALLANARSIADTPTLPGLSDVRGTWDRASAAIARRLAVASPAELDGPAPHGFPVGGPTLLGALGFLAQHDSYHVGQLALLRKLAGLPAMTYASPAAPAV
jgi:uncharacterized damage-inducible protein DinB